ncbi:MAG TPA: urate hydroxylase PuuD [Candidatus Acidoferrales bacterium]|nr:urate hydroxylase PuuD [Candidatus Acidoferrales bacterium]
MDFDLSEWLNLIARWVHVFAGILWIGQTYFFTWLDHNLHAGEGDSVWMVHSGGFYVVGKRTTLGVSPASVRWFRWEAAITWLSGMFLLVLVYYFGGLLLEADSKLSLGTAIGIGVAVLVAGWLVYDLIWISPLARTEGAAVALCFVLLAGAVYGLTHVFSGRAAYMHVGALLGTVMAANVWMRILPAQRRMIAAVAEGKTPDPNLAARAKQRSKHNTFMVVPVIFIMISNHFPIATYGHTYNWGILLVLILLGWGAAYALRRA